VLVRLGREVQEVSRPLSGDLTRLVAIGGLGTVLALAYTTSRILDQAGRDDRQPADAIVVMGAAQYDGRPSPLYQARLDHAIELVRNGVAQHLVVTGGKADGDRTTEAAAGRDYAVAHGVAASAILVEDASRTTLQSIRGVAGVMRGAGLHSAVFVSDPTHMLRVLRMATDAGITAWGSPTRTSPLERDTIARADAVVHELGALGLYFLSGDSP
jgi:uncharacterized SAM-binding protein YcdF (DUF218 family)